MWRAFPAGTWVDLRGSGSGPEPDLNDATGWRDERLIRAEVVAALLLGEAGPQPGKRPGIRLRGVRVTGRLDLMGATLGYSLVCELCRFDSSPRLVEASTRTIRLVDCWLPGFNGARMHADGMFSLHRSTAAGMVILDRAKVTGEAYLREATVGDGGEVAVAADGLTVDGDLDCTQVTCRGAVKLQGARVTGLVHASGAMVSRPGPRALDADNAVIGGYIAARGLAVDGELLLEHAQVGGYLDLRGARLNNPGGWALAGGGLTVNGRMWCHEGFTALGEVRLIGARIRGGLQLVSARLQNPDQTALTLDRTTLADVDAAGITAAGTIRLAGSRVTGHIDLSDAKLTDGDGATLVIDGANVAESLDLTRLNSAGEITMHGGHVGGRILLTSAEVRHRPGTAVDFSQSDAADLICDSMTTDGTVQLAGIKIARHLRMEDVHLASTEGAALDARSCQAGEFSLQRAEVRGDVVLEHARVGIYRDDPSHWPRQLHLDGLSYDVLEPRLPARQRLRWVTCSMLIHQPQPFEQLAAFYTRIGQPGEARRVLHAKERDQRSAKTPLGQAWSLLQDIAVGYGYQPWRAAVWFMTLLAIGSIVYSVAPPRALIPATAPHFYAVAYTLDLLLPVVNLGQKYAFSPTGLEQWLSYLLIAAGWILATTIAAAITRTLRRLSVWKASRLPSRLHTGNASRAQRRVTHL